MGRHLPDSTCAIVIPMTEGGFTLEQIHALVRQKFHFNFEPITLGSELAKVRMITDLPKMIKPLSLEEFKKFFTNQAQELAPEILE